LGFYFFRLGAFFPVPEDFFLADEDFFAAVDAGFFSVGFFAAGFFLAFVGALPVFAAAFFLGAALRGLGASFLVLGGALAFSVAGFFGAGFGGTSPSLDTSCFKRSSETLFVCRHRMHRAS